MNEKTTDTQLPAGWAGRAQRILRRAFIKMVNECGLVHRPDLFVTLTMISVSTVIAETISSAKIATPEGVDETIRFSLNEFEKLLREDLAGRVAHDAIQKRH